MEKVRSKLKKFFRKIKGEDRPMNVVGHLTELRNRVAVVLVIFLVAVITCYVFTDEILDYCLQIGSSFSFIYISPSELVMAYVRISVVCGIVVVIPVILYEIWAFMRPALTKTERRYGFLALLGGTVFFALGAYFAFRLMIPFMIQFFTTFDTRGEVAASITVENYIGFLLTPAVTFGAIFEMPVAAMLLSSLGLVKAEYLRKFRKYAVLIVFIVAAVITPPDVVSQILIALPMLGLYELSTWICRFIEKRKARKEAAEEKQSAG